MDEQPGQDASKPPGKRKSKYRLYSDPRLFYNSRYRPHLYGNESVDSERQRVSKNNYTVRETHLKQTRRQKLQTEGEYCDDRPTNSASTLKADDQIDIKLTEEQKRFLESECIAVLKQVLFYGPYKMQTYIFNAFLFSKF